MGIFDTLLAALGYTKANAPSAATFYPPPDQRGGIQYGGPMTFPGWPDLTGKAPLTKAARAMQSMQSAWAYSDIQLIANEASAAKLKIMERLPGKEEPAEVLNHPFEQLWNTPNPFMSRSFVSIFGMYQLLQRGERYYFFAPQAGKLAEIWPVPAHTMTECGDGQNYLTHYEYRKNGDPKEKPITISPEYICRTWYPHPDDPRKPFAPLDAADAGIALDWDMKRWNKNFFGKDNAVPAHLVSVHKDMPTPDFLRFKQELFDFFGSGQRRTMVARGGDVDVKDLAGLHKDMEFNAGRLFNRDEIDRAFGFPGGFWTANATEANARGAKAIVIENAVWPKLVLEAENLSVQVIRYWYGPQYFAVFEDIRPRNRELELRERAANESTWSVNELRKAQGKDPFPGKLWDEIPAAVANRIYQLEQPAAPPPPTVTVQSRLLPAPSDPERARDDSLEDADETKHLPGGHQQKRHAWRSGLSADKIDAMPEPERQVYQARHGGKDKTTTTKQPAKANDAAKTKAFGNDPTTLYEFRHKVVELDSLITSNTQSGAVNPAYSQELQPRDRSRAASQHQIDQVAAKLTPEAMIYDFHQIDKGSPIIGSDNMVESGNGRTLALQRAKELHPEKWQEYQDKLREHADKLGIDPRELDGMKNPVVVRERLGDDDRVAFAREANAPPVLQMSTLETAQVDSRRLKDDDALSLKVKDDQTIDQALRHRDNAPFVKRFMATLPANERAALMRSDGTLNQMGIYRMKGALFTRAFPGQSGGKIAESFLESVDSNVKNFENAVSATLPGLTRAQSLTNSGARHKDLDMSDDIATAIHVYSRIKDQDRFTVDDYLGQESMFDRETTPRQDKILKHFDTIGRSPKRIKDFLSRYVAGVEKSAVPGQNSMFGDDDRMTADELLDKILKGDD